MSYWRLQYVQAGTSSTMEELWACMYLNAYLRGVPKPPSKKRKPKFGSRQSITTDNRMTFRQPVQFVGNRYERRCLADMESLLPESNKAGGGDSDKEQEWFHVYHNDMAKGFTKWNRMQLKLPTAMEECSTCGHPTPVAILYESKGRQQCLPCKTYWHEAQRYGV